MARPDNLPRGLARVQIIPRTSGEQQRHRPKQRFSLKTRKFAWWVASNFTRFQYFSFSLPHERVSFPSPRSSTTTLPLPATQHPPAHSLANQLATHKKNHVHATQAEEAQERNRTWAAADGSDGARHPRRPPVDWRLAPSWDSGREHRAAPRSDHPMRGSADLRPRHQPGSR
jgi:hypothetical protein